MVANRGVFLGHLCHQDCCADSRWISKAIVSMANTRWLGPFKLFRGDDILVLWNSCLFRCQKQLAAPEDRRQGFRHTRIWQLAVSSWLRPALRSPWLDRNSHQFSSRGDHPFRRESLESFHV